MTVALTVVANLSTPSIGLDRHAAVLDGPLSWAYAMRAHANKKSIPPLTPTSAPDFPLPLAIEARGDDWVWCVSRAHLDIIAWTGVQIRRKPAIEAMARYGREAKHHVALGPYKARDASLNAVYARSVTWHLLSTDEADLADLLGYITHLGARHRNGFGHVSTWQITPCPNPELWRDRPTYGRAPYHHPSRKKTDD